MKLISLISCLIFTTISFGKEPLAVVPLLDDLHLPGGGQEELNNLLGDVELNHLEGDVELNHLEGDVEQVEIHIFYSSAWIQGVTSGETPLYSDIDDYIKKKELFFELELNPDEIRPTSVHYEPQDITTENPEILWEKNTEGPHILLILKKATTIDYCLVWSDGVILSQFNQQPENIDQDMQQFLNSHFL
jgi:hypothetical protein